MIVYCWGAGHSKSIFLVAHQLEGRTTFHDPYGRTEMSGPVRLLRQWASIQIFDENFVQSTMRVTVCPNYLLTSAHKSLRTLNLLDSIDDCT